jgi:hypothetical protein
MTDADALRSILLDSATVAAALDRLTAIALPDWYLGAGCVAQTVWNVAHGFAPNHGIDDFDIVYFDPTDLSAETEASVEGRVHDALADLGVRVDVTNEARVHLWYGERFGRDIEPYRSTEHAISTWPTTASSIGVRGDGRGDGWRVCAPFGVDDLFALIVRPNQALISRQVYEAKAARWAAIWPRLTVVPW